MHWYCCTAVLIQGIHTKSNTERIHNFVTFSFAMPWSTSTRSKPNQSSRPGNSNTVTALSCKRLPTKTAKTKRTYKSTGQQQYIQQYRYRSIEPFSSIGTVYSSTIHQLTHHVQQYSRKAVLQYMHFCGTPSVYNRNLSFRNKRLLQIVMSGTRQKVLRP